jgi:hypothetical protein
MPTTMGDRRLANNVKAVLIAEVHTAKNDPAMKSMLKLIDFLIDETRILNDTAEGNDVYRNQGAILALRALLDYALRDMPGTNQNN